MAPVRVGAAVASTTTYSAPTTSSRRNGPLPNEDMMTPEGAPPATTTTKQQHSEGSIAGEEEVPGAGINDEDNEEHEESAVRPLLLASSLRSSLRGLQQHTSNGGSSSTTNGKKTSSSPQRVLFASSAKKSASSSSVASRSSNKKNNAASNKSSSLFSLMPSSSSSSRNKSDGEWSWDRPKRRRRLIGIGRGSNNHGGIDGDVYDDDYDPVMALFHARANHRVTFSLEQPQPPPPPPHPIRGDEEHRQQQTVSRKSAKGKERGRSSKVKRGRAAGNAAAILKEESAVAEPQPHPKRSSSLKTFVRSALFGSGKSDKLASLADIEAEVASVHDGADSGADSSGCAVDDSLDVDDDDSALDPVRQRYLGSPSSPMSDDDMTSSSVSSLPSTMSSSIGRGSVDAQPGSPSPPRSRARHYGGLGKGGNVDSSDGSEPPPPPPPPAALFRQAITNSPPTAAAATATPAASSSPKSISSSATTPKRKGIRWGSGSSNSPNDSSAETASPPKPVLTPPHHDRASHKISSSSPKGSPTRNGTKGRKELAGAATSFVEQKQVRSQINVLLNKANRAHHVHYRYEYAVKCCMKALELQKKAHYPEDHPTVLKTLQYLNSAHHALSSLENSANIVKMGIKYEDAGDWIRALKMYTIAYRIRRDNLSSSHPSLVVLLNMLGSIQVKRDELEEAMEIFELALKDDPRLMGDGNRDLVNSHDHTGDYYDDYELGHGSDEGLHIHEHKEADLDPPRHAHKAPLPSRSTTTTTTTANNNVLAKSVAYREMGIIYERWGDADEALKMYHRSLDCIAEYKGLVWKAPVLSRHVPTLEMPMDDALPVGAHPMVSPSPVAAGAAASTSSPSHSESTRSPSRSATNTSTSADEDVNNTTISSCPVSLSNEEDILLDLESVHLSRSFVMHATVVKSHKEDDGQFESGMELFLNGDEDGSSRTLPAPLITSTCYDVFFQGGGAGAGFGRKKSKSKDVSTANVDVALTLHQIGQLHRAEGEYNLALAAYAVSLRGMREELGKNHPNVAAVLGNIGNLQKEMGDLNAAYETYQQVLAIESYRLGLSHPEVASSLHNVATIEAARGNHKNALTLYEQVMSLQRKLFGDDHLSLAVTATCMGDVYERIGEIDKAIDAFDEALRIKTSVVGRHSIEVGRILHKLGKLSALNGDVQLADSYLSRTVLIYRLNKMRDDDGWMIEVNRDVADIDALIAMGRSEDLFEC